MIANFPFQPWLLHILPIIVLAVALWLLYRNARRFGTLTPVFLLVAGIAVSIASLASHLLTYVWLDAIYRAQGNPLGVPFHSLNLLLSGGWTMVLGYLLAFAIGSYLIVRIAIRHETSKGGRQ